MGGLLKILGGPLGDIFGTIERTIDNLHTSDQEKLQAKLELAKAEFEFRERVMEAEGQLAKAQAGVVESEAQGESWLQRNWRPVLMLTFTYIIAHNFVISPLFGINAVPVPGDMWELLKLGITGYITGRSVEKVLPEVVEVLKSNRENRP